MAAGKDDRSLGELFAELAQETSTLVRQEMHLAVEEVGHRAGTVGKEIGVAAAGGVLAFTSFLVLVAAVIYALADLGLDWWFAALIVAVVLAGAAYMLIKRAASAIKHADILPRRTIQHLKEDQEWVKEQVG